MACALARIGRFEDAKELIRALRVDFGTGSSGQISVWIMLAEGLTHLYEDLSPLAFDRVNRAFVLSSAMKYRAMIALSGAWKAHLEFETSKFEAMCVTLRQAIASAETSNDDAHVRLTAVLANSFMIAGNRSQAQRLFLRGREHALRIGDQASLEALVYNRATFGLSWLRAESCLGRDSRDDFSLLKVELQSAKNFQDLTGISALSNHIDLWRARLLVLEHKFEEAIDALVMIRDAKPFAAYNFRSSFIDLELAYCHMKLGDTSAALALASEIGPGFDTGLDIDDRLVASWMAHQLCQVLGVFGPPETRELELKARATDYENWQSHLATMLQEFETY